MQFLPWQVLFVLCCTWPFQVFRIWSWSLYMWGVLTCRLWKSWYQTFPRHCFLSQIFLISVGCLPFLYHLLFSTFAASSCLVNWINEEIQCVSEDVFLKSILAVYLSTLSFSSSLERFVRNLRPSAPPWQPAASMGVWLTGLRSLPSARALMC